MQNLIARVAVKKINFQADKLYDYIVPEELRSEIKIGQTVVVPFGKNNKKQHGLVLEICEYNTNNINLKYICNILKNNLCVSEEMIKIIEYLKETCFCTYYEAFRTVMPEILSEKLTKITYVINNNIIYDNLNKQEQEFLYNFRDKNSFSSEDLKKLNIKNYYNIINSLLNKNIITEKINISGLKTPKNNKILKLKENFDIYNNKLTQKQLVICEYLKKHDNISIQELSKLTNINNNIIKRLILKNIIIEYEPENNTENLLNNIILNSEQEYVFNDILNTYKHNNYNTCLLHGVTGSGKTQVILKLIDYALSINKSVIFLVPEIALTTQFLELFRSKYKNICLIHSSISNSEKIEAWKKAQDNNPKIILGPRSAVFAPVNNLGLIIMDEEHDSAYKSDSNPKFHTHNIAKFRCKYHNCMLILASATPSLESYYQAKKNNYNLSILKNRYKNNKLPDTKIIDMNNPKEFIKNSVFSRTFLDMLIKNFEKKQQSIILVNRRGYNTFVKCSNCNEVQMCPYCSVSLVYHKTNNKLICHYCNYHKNFAETCSYCNQNSLYYLGFGTQKAENELVNFIPKSKILRIDSDTNNNLNIREKLKEFEKNKYDILIGTQMISKGFNFPNVSLVGVLTADQSLFESDFRSYERTFSLLTQTIGRSGRHEIPGQAVIQTFSPENKILKLASKQDYENFCRDEINMRKITVNPPFSDICIILFKSKNQDKIIKTCNLYFENIKNLAKNKYPDIPLRIFSPSPTIIHKISDYYRYKIIIKCKNNRKFRDFIREIFSNQDLNSSNVSISIDMNPSLIN